MEKPEVDLVVLEIGGKTVRLKRPSRQVVSLAMAKAAKDVLDATEVLVENCYHDGDLSKEDILGNVGILMGISQKTNEIIGVVEVSLKKS
jgi:hypothetical protein